MANALEGHFVVVSITDPKDIAIAILRAKCLGVTIDDRKLRVACHVADNIALNFHADNVIVCETGSVIIYFNGYAGSVTWRKPEAAK